MKSKKRSTKSAQVKAPCVTLYAQGMHCAACELLIEKKLSKVDGVKKVDAVLSSNQVKIWGHFDMSTEELAEEMSGLIEKDGYTLSTKKVEKKEVNWGQFKTALPIAAVLILLFIGLQKAGILTTISPSSISLPAVFLIGIIASLSSCMAVVGGLVLSISANYAKEESKAERAKPMVMFHVSRIVSFFILGGIVGLLGSAFTLNRTMSFVLGILVAFVMVILALNLLDIWDFTKKLQFKMPKSLSKTALNTENIENKFTPAILGAATFFLPCGFTQSMQIQALAKQSFFGGASLMFVYALGTLPVLALLSFASNKLVDSKSMSGVFFKTAGLVVLFFAMINLVGALVVMGIMEPIFNF